jgi:sterol desaturase/sphingolipid hydroxylase (fatty acid hydroxylase superfamily)
MLEIVYQWRDLFLAVLTVALACAPGEILARKERHSVASRVRGAIFMAIYLGAYAASLVVAMSLINYFGVKPLVTIDLTSWRSVVLALLMTFVPFFLADGFYYWFHRLQHATPVLWRFHAAHHAIEDLNATNCYHHWTEGFLRISFVVVPVTLLFHLQAPQIAYLALVPFVLSAWGQFVHSSAPMTLGPLEHLFVSPQFHRAHHSLHEGHHHRNFSGVFPIFDIIFGTAYFPKPDEVIDIGLSDRNEAMTLGQYLFALKPKKTDQAALPG